MVGLDDVREFDAVRPDDARCYGGRAVRDDRLPGLDAVRLLFWGARRLRLPAVSLPQGVAMSTIQIASVVSAILAVVSRVIYLVYRAKRPKD